MISYVTIPLPDLSFYPHPSLAVLLITLGMCKLLMIDDNEVDQFIMDKMLEKYQLFHHKTFNSSGEAAFNNLQSHQTIEEELPDIILLDLNMPEYSGADFLEKFSQLRQTIKKRIDVFIVSASLSPVDMALTSRFPFVKEYIIKPVSREILSRIHASYGV